MVKTARRRREDRLSNRALLDGVANRDQFILGVGIIAILFRRLQLVCLGLRGYRLAAEEIPPPVISVAPSQSSPCAFQMSPKLGVEKPKTANATFLGNYLPGGCGPKGCFVGCPSADFSITSKPPLAGGCIFRV
ncbi:hypothetical protein ACJJTC_002265 [Scirpophaga incertulas]